MELEEKLYYLVAKGLVKFGQEIEPDEVDRLYKYVGFVRQEEIEDRRFAVNSTEKEYTKYMRGIQKDHG